MKEQLINEIQRKMLPYLNNEQLLRLRNILDETLCQITKSGDGDVEKPKESNMIKSFIVAKRIEGCSEKTLNYYRKTIESMISSIGKIPHQITTDDLRKYLTDYQMKRNSSKVTIDNIRRILSSFFSWLEDEDYIIKSPVRRIHKVKTAKVIKDTYSDEELELMRDNCGTIRDLAIIDLLASSGMRVGEMVMLNKDDISFSERECVVFGKGSKERLVYFDARTKIHLCNYLESRTDNNPALFVSLRKPYRRVKIGGIETMLRNLGRQLNLSGKIVGGATPSTKCDNYYGGDISWITPKDLSVLKGRYIACGERTITKEGLDSCSAQIMPPNTVLFTSRAPIGYIAIASENVCTNQGFKSVVANNKVDPLFLYYLLKYNRDYIEAMGSGTTFKEVSGKTMKFINVRIPSDLICQKKIALMLDNLDSKIETNDQINDHLAA